MQYKQTSPIIKPLLMHLLPWWDVTMDLIKFITVMQYLLSWRFILTTVLEGQELLMGMDGQWKMNLTNPFRLPMFPFIVPDGKHITKPFTAATCCCKTSAKSSGGTVLR